MDYRRSDRSHVRDDGTPKISYETEGAARQVADLTWQRSGKPQNIYLCEQKPSHWHVGRGVPDLEVK